MSDKLIANLQEQAKLIIGTRNCRSRELHLAAAADLARLTAELERSRRECDGLRAGIDSAMRAYENECYHAANAYLHKALEEVAALSAGGSDGNA